MPAERYYIPQQLETLTTISVEGQEYHHLATVMRTRLGEEVEIINGQGQLAIATVSSLEKKRAVLSIQTVHSEELPKKKMVLAQGFPRFARLEFILEKGTELGMTEIILFPASRSEKKDLSENQFARLDTLAIASMKQCGRLFLPKITLCPPLNKWTETSIKNCFFGDLRDSAPTFQETWPKGELEGLFFIGPESGFTDEEVEQMERLQAKGAKLNPNILRTETAAIAALAILAQQMMDLPP